MKVLVTGGAGYIGSHLVLLLLHEGFDVVVLDNFSNSKKKSIDNVSYLSGRVVDVEVGDIRDFEFLTGLFSRHAIDVVIHMAGLKSVADSVANPFSYYDNNIIGTIRLLDAMAYAGIGDIIFSSSATVYGSCQMPPYKESDLLLPNNPYGNTKLCIERLLTDFYDASHLRSVVILRYFNPVGAHPSGLIGEMPSNIPSNLMPYIAQVAAGSRDNLLVYGGDYNTPDGTGIRDFIHVMDLAKGHISALRNKKDNGLTICNLGTGKGYSVLDVVNTFSIVNGVPIPYKIVGRRSGDVAVSYADVNLASDLFGWTAELDLEAMCRDHWSWQLHFMNSQAGKLV